MLKPETIKKWADEQTAWYSINYELTERERSLIQACFQHAALQGWRELNENRDAVWLIRRAVLDDCERAGSHRDYLRAQAARTLADLLHIWKNID